MLCLLVWASVRVLGVGRVEQHNSGPNALPYVSINFFLPVEMVEILNEHNEADFFTSEKALKAVLFSNTIASMPACSSHICGHASMSFALVPSPSVPAGTAKTRPHACYAARSIDYEATYIVSLFVYSGVAS